MAMLSYAYKTPVFYDCEEELKSSTTLESDFLIGTVYPNPTMDKIIVENYCSEELFAELVNQLGKQILKITIPKGPTSQILSLASLPAGLYIMHLTGCATTMSKIIVKTQ